MLKKKKNYSKVSVVLVLLPIGTLVQTLIYVHTELKKDGWSVFERKKNVYYS